ncbi:MAG: hypothetical protein COT43_10055 [Candidatus Marinimicrobia bacterium CG08_land_8_20_14_0_20_45_22]|nr:MAG: hypothetical protein COT43_10055 [Candidatus Marinimicrobia bacterium CG08_land_8_20_14_0_20_45_22]
MDKHTQNIAFTGIFIGLILGVGYALAFIPNVELITAMVFMSGVLMGLRRGILIGCVGEFLFSALNPVGSGILFPPMLIAQIISVGIIGAAGGIFGNFVLSWKPNPTHVCIIALLGATLTLLYDILVSVAFPISAGFNLKAIGTTLIAGIAFSVVHLVINTLIFIFIVPIASQKVYVAISYFHSDEKK